MTRIKYLYLDFEIEDYNLSVRKKNKAEIGNPAKVEESKFLSVAINVSEETKRGEPKFIDLRDLERGIQELAETLVNRNFDFADGVVVVHNAPYDIPLLEKLGVTPKSIVDTMSLAALHNSREPSYSLGDLGEKYLGLKKLEAPNFDRNTDMDKLSEYNLRDVEITEKLHIFYSESIGREMSEVIELEAKSTKIVCEMMENGVRLDKDWLETFLEDSKEEWETMLNRSKSFGVENPNSSKQIIKYLEKFGITPPEKTKTGNPSVGRESIERMLKEYKRDGRQAEKVSGVPGRVQGVGQKTKLCGRTDSKERKNRRFYKQDKLQLPLPRLPDFEGRILYLWFGAGGNGFEVFLLFPEYAAVRKRTQGPGTGLEKVDSPPPTFRNSLFTGLQGTGNQNVHSSGEARRETPLP